MSQHAIDALKQSNIRRVIMVGRDGPLQACFTTRELREMTGTFNISYNFFCSEHSWSISSRCICWLVQWSPRLQERQ